MKFLANQKLATRISIITTAITFTGLLLLWFIVANRVASAEEYVTAFALSSEVQDLLANPEDPALLQKGQKYTEDFAAVKGIFEGLYISTPDTYVLTHTSQGGYRDNYPGRRLLNRIPKYNSRAATADQSRYYGISGNRNIAFQTQGH